jgi:hypothetical protein
MSLSERIHTFGAILYPTTTRGAFANQEMSILDSAGTESTSLSFHDHVVSLHRWEIDEWKFCKDDLTLG